MSQRQSNDIPRFSSQLSLFTTAKNMPASKKRKLTEAPATAGEAQSASSVMDTDRTAASYPNLDELPDETQGELGQGTEVAEPPAADVTAKTKERQDRFKALQARAVSLL